MYTEILIGITVWLLVSFLLRTKSSSKRPPGPWACPLIGNLLHFVSGRWPHLTFQKWANEFGPVYAIKMGSTDLIVISDPKLVKDLFGKGSSSGRPQNPVFTAYSNNSGVMMSDGSKWEVQRRFLIRTMKNLGFGKGSLLEGLILDEVKGLLSVLENGLEQPILGSGMFFHYVTGTLLGLISSDRDEADIKEKMTILEIVKSVMEGVNAATKSGLFFFPSLRFVAPGLTGWTKYVKNTEEFRNAVAKRIDKHKSRLDPNKPADFIDHFLLEIESTTDATSSFYKESGYANLVVAVMDMFLAGSDTTTNTLEWAMVYLSQNKNVQMAMQKELDEVIGRSCVPSLSDKLMLPYTEAVLLEILRFSCVALVGIAHRPLENIEFHGYLLPKDCIVLANLYTIHHNTSIWGSDANEFRPERFLSQDKTKVVKKDDSFIPFSAGKRQCLGESMAMDTLFLFVTCIFQKFNVDPDPNSLQPDLIGQPGFTSTPNPFRIIISLR